MTMQMAEIPANRAATAGDDPESVWNRLVTSCTGPDWRLARLPSEPIPAGPLDAIIMDDVRRIGPDELRTAVDHLLPLGRILMRGPAELLQHLVNTCNEPLSLTTQVSLGSGIRAAVVERHGDAGSPDRRRGAHPGAYKMSRYKAYHQMQAAIALLTDQSPRGVIEIGDSNGVLRDMLGHKPFEYFRAHYPPHDLQTLHLIPSSSCDVFICDNTLEHVADPHAAVHQMARVIRPGGWLVLFAPFIAMSQDDDRCRWSVRALTELLSREFDSGMLGGWGNVDAACWYMKANKWLRVLGVQNGSLRCRDSRSDQSPEVSVDASSDRLHPIHVWAVVRRAAESAATPSPNGRLSEYAGLAPGAKTAAAELVRLAGPDARYAVHPGDDGSFQDRFVELGARATAIHDSRPLATSALNRGFESIDSDAPGSVTVPLESAFDVLLLNSDALDSPPPSWIARAIKPGGVVAVTGSAPLPKWPGFAAAPEGTTDGPVRFLHRVHEITPRESPTFRGHQPPGA